MEGSNMAPEADPFRSSDVVNQGVIGPYEQQRSIYLPFSVELENEYMRAPKSRRRREAYGRGLLRLRLLADWIMRLTSQAEPAEDARREYMRAVRERWRRYGRRGTYAPYSY